MTAVHLNLAGALLTTNSSNGQQVSMVESAVVVGAFVKERFKGLSLLRGNSHDGFLGGGVAVTLLSYPT